MQITVTIYNSKSKCQGVNSFSSSADKSDRLETGMNSGVDFSQAWEIYGEIQYAGKKMAQDWCQADCPNCNMESYCQCVHL